MLPSEGREGRREEMRFISISEKALKHKSTTHTKENETSSAWLRHKVEGNGARDELLENYKGTR